ncbi:MAG: 2Fe-2S iron-sulfur cluster binding domain-containing protein [Hyphomicrobiales bacterium]|nr:2Fe-2S iron-sulfur cluster binding domain-containing protein [Hyphomicrobiales bacterium]MDE2113524.1 2Fe-2S iron-sulfur cluster binding domain-containing protein [Hyphomicrobiales bacterium]
MSNHFYPLTIADLQRETANAVCIRFDVPEALKARFAFRAGQHLTLRTIWNGEEIRRNYSLCAAPQEGELKIAIKHIAGGVFSSFANQSLAVGQTLDVMPAMGRFTHDFTADAHHNYVGIAAGSGITPVLSLLKAALLEEPDSQFTLIFGNRDSRSILFLEELADLKNRYMGRLAVHHFLSAEADEIDWFNGRLTRAKLAEICDSLVSVAKVDAFFICGPGAMMDNAEAVLRERGVGLEKILVERFGIAPDTADDSREIANRLQSATGLNFTAILDGRRRVIPFNPDKLNLLGSVQEAGLAAPYACKSGVCATCRAKLVSGSVEMVKNYGLNASELEQGYILTCQSFPLGPDVVIDYDF